MTEILYYALMMVLAGAKCIYLVAKTIEKVLYKYPFLPILVLTPLKFLGLIGDKLLVITIINYLILAIMTPFIKVKENA